MKVVCLFWHPPIEIPICAVSSHLVDIIIHTFFTKDIIILTFYGSIDFLPLIVIFDAVIIAQQQDTNKLIVDQQIE